MSEWMKIELMFFFFYLTDIHIPHSAQLNIGVSNFAVCCCKPTDLNKNDAF